MKRAGAVVAVFYKWCAEQGDYAIEHRPLHRALTYATNQRDAAVRFLTDGRIPIHNNDSERELRREAVGHKNWLFIGNDAGANANTTFVTLLASCQMHGIEPQGYRRDLLCLLPNWPLELVPAHWKQTRELETQKLLAANPFRSVALADLQAHPAQALPERGPPVTTVGHAPHTLRSQKVRPTCAPDDGVDPRSLGPESMYCDGSSPNDKHDRSSGYRNWRELDHCSVALRIRSRSAALTMKLDDFWQAPAQYRAHPGAGRGSQIRCALGSQRGLALVGVMGRVLVAVLLFGAVGLVFFKSHKASELESAHGQCVEIATAVQLDKTNRGGTCPNTFTRPG